jgi:hypothetical protein
LQQAFSVAQVNKNNPAMIATAVRPAFNGDGLVGVLFGDKTAVVGTSSHNV